MHRWWSHLKYRSAYERWFRAFRHGCRWLEENTHIQQFVMNTNIQRFWSEFHRHMYGPGQCCKEFMCRIRSSRLPWSVIITFVILFSPIRLHYCNGHCVCCIYVLCASIIIEKTPWTPTYRIRWSHQKNNR